MGLTHRHWQNIHYLEEMVFGLICGFQQYIVLFLNLVDVILNLLHKTIKYPLAYENYLPEIMLRYFVEEGLIV